MSPQEIFDKVSEHLLNQNARATLRGNLSLCAYKNADGLRCAVGCLIPYGHSAEDFCGGLGGLLMTYPDLKKTFGIEGHNWSASSNYTLLRQLQNLHDNNEPSEWPRLLRNTAKEFGLNATSTTT